VRGQKLNQLPPLFLVSSAKHEQRSRVHAAYFTVAYCQA
jgi:hypothetical protein